MELDEKALLSDAKLDIKREIDPKNKSKHSFDLLMYSFANDRALEYENGELAKNIYRVLEWNENYFDVINSFWTSFSFVMHCKYPKIYEVAQAGNVKIYKNHYKGYDSFPEKFISKQNNEICDSVEGLDLFKSINEFASLCHCVANFMPCPDNNFNSAKGLLADVRDYFPLMIDKIQQCIDYKKDLEFTRDGNKIIIDMNTLDKWHSWFVNNREKYCLEPYYYIKKFDEKSVIKGIPLFKNQALEYPCPKNEDDAKECLNEMIKRIQCRANLIVLNYTE